MFKISKEVPKTEDLLEETAKDQTTKIPPPKTRKVIINKHKVNKFKDTGDSFSGSSIINCYLTSKKIINTALVS